MPVYEYECPSCGVIEVTQRITEAPLSRCPNNCGNNVTRILSVCSVKFVGDGFYCNDYKPSKKEKQASQSPPKERTD